MLGSFESPSLPAKPDPAILRPTFFPTFTFNDQQSLLDAGAAPFQSPVLSFSDPPISPTLPDSIVCNWTIEKNRRPVMPRAAPLLYSEQLKEEWPDALVFDSWKKKKITHPLTATKFKTSDVSCGSLAALVAPSEGKEKQERGPSLSIRHPAQENEKFHQTELNNKLENTEQVEQNESNLSWELATLGPEWATPESYEWIDVQEGGKSKDSTEAVSLPITVPDVEPMESWDWTPLTASPLFDCGRMSDQLSVELDEQTEKEDWSGWMPEEFEALLEDYHGWVVLKMKY